METKSKLLERKGILAKELRDILAKSSDKLSPDDELRFDKVEADLSELEKNIDRLERASKFETIENNYQEAVTEERATTRGGDSKTEAFHEYMKRGELMSQKNRDILQRGTDPQIAGTTTAGGYYVPKLFSDKVVEVMKAYGGILGAVSVDETPSGASFYLPTEDTTSQKGAIITETTADVVLDYTIGQKAIGAYTYTSKIIQLSWELLQDNIYNAEQRVIGIAGRRLARIIADHLVTGTGSGQPEGFIVGAGSAAVTTASATAVTPDEVLDLIHSLDTTYRNGAFLVFNDATLKTLRKFKATTGEPIWQTFKDGALSTIYGVPYVVDHSVASAGTASAKFMAYGNFNEAFYVRKVLNDSLVVMREKYADQRMNGYFVHSRWDAKVINANAVKFMAHAAS